MELVNFFIKRWDSVMELAGEHLLLVLTAMGIAGVFMTIPSLALFAY